MNEMIRLSEAVEFAHNPDPRCPCILLLDTSGSMQGDPIKALNDGLRRFKEDLIGDTLAVKRVEVAVITFDSEVRVIQDFVTPDDFIPPVLTAQGMTYTAGGIQKALDLIQERKQVYRDNDILYYRPWIFLITDGEPQGETGYVVDQAVRRIAEEEDQKRVAFFGVGVGNVNMVRLAQITTRTPVRLQGLKFDELFAWLSASMAKVSQSKTDEQVALPPPGWIVI